MTQPSEPPQTKSKTTREAYNIVTDLGAGPNIRLKDNLIQAVCVAVFLVIGLLLGLGMKTDPPVMGILVGAIIGLVVGVFLSGIGLMIYRGIRHIKGKHD